MDTEGTAVFSCGSGMLAIGFGGVKAEKEA